MGEAGKPAISFCMATYKRPSYLQSTLKSILLQTYSDYEVIISDNDTEQSGRAVVESFNDQRFRYFPNGENLGMIKSFNKSIERSQGDFIVMITDDDPVYPHMLSTLVTLREQYPGYGMYLGGCDWYCDSIEVGELYGFKVGTNSCLSKVFAIDYTKAYQPEEFLDQLFSFGIFPHYLWSTCMVKREVLLKMKGVPDYGTPFLGDYAYIGIMASDSGCVVINRSLGCQTLHDENFGRKQNEQIVVAANNFPQYVEQKVAQVPAWNSIKEKMLRFTALWVISHLVFLHQYSHEKGIRDESLKIAEKEVFRIGFVKKYRFKYFLKKNLPFVHDQIVKLKKSIKK